MVIGDGRVPTAEQNPRPPDRRAAPLWRGRGQHLHRHLQRREGIPAEAGSGARLLRPGDTRLDRLGRSVVHLVLLGADLRARHLREREAGLKVTEQGIDTATAEDRAMFGMLSVLAELQRELIVANTRDGLAAARARERKGAADAPSSPRPRSARPSGSTTKASTPSNRSPPCSASTAPPSMATWTRAPSVPGPARPRTPARPGSWPLSRRSVARSALGSPDPGASPRRR
jgi:hypothetical protein